MKKALYVFAIAVLTATVALAGVNRVAQAGGTVPCNPWAEGNGDLSMCNTSVVTIPADKYAKAWEIPVEDLPAQSGPWPFNNHPVATAVQVYVYDANGNMVTWIVPPLKICFPVYEGQVRRYVAPTELSSWLGYQVSYGYWERLATFSENGMTCAWTYELPGPFAVFQAIN